MHKQGETQQHAADVPCLPPSQVRAYLDDELEDLVPSSLRHAREIFAQFKASSTLVSRE